MSAIGDVLTRQRGKGTRRIRIVGVYADRYVVTSADAFEPPCELTPAELQEEYGGSPDPIDPIPESEHWQRLDRDWLHELNRQIAAKEQTAEPLLTIEQKLTLEAEG